MGQQRTGQANAAGQLPALYFRLQLQQSKIFLSAAYWAADAEPTSLVMLCATREEYMFISCSNLGYRRYKIQFNDAPNNTPGHLREDSIALRLNYVF